MSRAKSIKKFLSEYKQDAMYLDAQDNVSKLNIYVIWVAEQSISFGTESGGEEVIVRFDEEDHLLLPDKIEALYLSVLMYYHVNAKVIKSQTGGRVYTREGMVNRVLQERRQKSMNAEYKVVCGKFLYGPHALYDEQNVRYDITIWDFDQMHGYIDNIDWKTNKLATTKHIMFLVNWLKEHPSKSKTLLKSSQFIEIVPDPLFDYFITYKYQGKISKIQEEKIDLLFEGKTHLGIADLVKKLPILNEFQELNYFIIRTEVYRQLEAYFDSIEEAKFISENQSKAIDYSFLKASLFDYQKAGVAFCLFKKGAILADEMGLGKTLQAMSIAILKKTYYGFKKTLIVCPASVKYQWLSEINKFTDESAIVVEGKPDDRAFTYMSEDHYFFIVNYETVLRDKTVIDNANFDFIILDEAQKIKNFEAKVSKAITDLKKQHGLVITGTPIENKLIDLYAIMLFVDRYKITPLWQFSYQHCIFDYESKTKINGYYDLQNLKSVLNDIVIRRQKRNVLKDLPSVMEQNVFVSLHPEQSNIHAGLMNRLAQILAKKFKTAFDYDQIMLLLTNMRRVSNSTYLLDKETNFSSKMVELEQILLDQLNLDKEKKKIIIFSEWIDSLKLIEELLTKYKVGYTKLTGKVPPKKRNELIKTFEKEEDCKVFLSTEAGGAGLNLQIADTLINFELPWNPAKKNQRIGRIDRIGQSSKKLNIFNLLCRNSIEMHIASGLLLKQNLFESVLNVESEQDSVDFSQEGRAQFIRQLEQMIAIDDLDQNEADSEIIEDINTVPEDAILGHEAIASQASEPSTTQGAHQAVDKQKMAEVMQRGMDFLSGMYEMATGQKLANMEGRSIEIDEETREMVIRFKF